MLDHDYLPDPGLVLMAQIDPFETRELKGFLTWFSRDSGIPGDTPMLIDMRRRALAKSTTAQIRRFTIWRKGLVDLPAGPVAVLVRTEADFGLVRVWQQHMALRGVRREQDAVATQDIDEAVAWVIARSARPDANPAPVMAALEWGGSASVAGHDP